MEIKKKNLSKTNWSRIIERQTAICELEEENIKGKARINKNIKTKICFNKSL